MSNFYQKLCDAIGAASVREQEPMSAHTTFRAGGPARYFVIPEGEKELAAVLAACREAEKAYYILGNGSNLLVSDAGYPGVMILLGSQFTEVVCPEGEPGVYELGAGVLLSRAAREAQKDGMTGFEFAAGRFHTEKRKKIPVLHECGRLRRRIKGCAGICARDDAGRRGKRA